jgi:outer membrane protein OmpA-like peptidoglycan-associated protein
VTVRLFLFSLLLILLAGCTRPLFVTHLSARGVALTKKKGQFMPSHKFINRLMCFDEKCLNKAAWAKKQRKQRFKGYKDGGKTPASKPKAFVTEDSVLIARKESKPIQHEAIKKQDQIMSPPLLKTDSVIVLNEVFFEVNSFKLKPSLYPKLDSLVIFMHKSLRHEVTISGHTDNTGTESHNLRLSDHRAESVARYLADKGIDIARITFNGYGSARPVASNDTTEGRGKNRRVEVIIHELR